MYENGLVVKNLYSALLNFLYVLFCAIRRLTVMDLKVLQPRGTLGPSSGN